MNTTSRRGAIIGLLALLAACGGSDIATTAGGPTATTLPPSPARPAEFPPLSGPSRTYIFSREESYPVSDFTKQSQWVLYDNGAFALQYPKANAKPGEFHSYSGAYLVESGTVFLFELPGATNDGHTWVDATGTLKGDSLTIQFSLNMEQSDFENAVYVLKL